MRSERGQATVEWIGVVLLVAVALAALARFTPRADGRSLATTLARSLTHPAQRAHAPEPAPLPLAAAQPLPRREGFMVPPLVPRLGQMPPRPRLRLPAAPALLRGARRGAGLAWRRAWFACLAYERLRWALLHPESRFPGYTMPPSEVLRIANDCISPVDFVRDWPLLRGR
jgi:hypothetical protein